MPIGVCIKCKYMSDNPVLAITKAMIAVAMSNKPLVVCLWINSSNGVNIFIECFFPGGIVNAGVLLSHWIVIFVSYYWVTTNYNAY